MDKNMQAVKVFNEHASQYQEKYMNVDLYKNSFDLFCSLVKNHASVFELGCGPGNITKYLFEKRPDFKIWGTDLAPNMVALARMNNPEAKFDVMDCREIKNISEKFDAVMCGFCLPYLSKEESIALIGDIAAILNPGGVIYISTMEDDYTKSGLKRSSDGKSELFMYFHEAEYLVTALEKNKFEIVNLHRQEYPSAGSEKTIDMIIIARK